MKKRFFQIAFFIALFAAGTAALHAQPAEAGTGDSQAAEEIVGFPVFKSIRTQPQPPVIDGLITDDLPAGVRPDAGWRAAGRITLSNGVNVPDVAFQGLKEAKGDFLDLSFEVRHDPSLDEGDAVVVGLRPLGLRPREDPSPAEWLANDLVIIVYPFSGEGSAAAVPAGGAPARVEIWKYAGDAGWKDVSALVKGCQWAARAFDATDDSKGWDLECRLPVNAAAGGDAWVNIPDRFAFYFNVIRVQSGAMPSVSQFFWPRRGRPLAGALEPAALSPGDWGRADKSDSSAQKGLWIAASDIAIAPANSADAGDDFYIAFDNSTASVFKFAATVSNETSRAAGTILDYLDAANVSVLFRSADWGIGGANPGPDWKPLDEVFVPERGFSNPTKPKTVPQADNPTKPGTVPFEFQGALGPNLPAGIETPNRRCLYAELEAPAGTYFRERGVYRNVINSTSPVLEEKAVLSVRGYGPAPAGKSGHAYLLRTEKRSWTVRKTANPFTGQEVLTTDTASAEAKSDINSYLEWTFHGFLLTAETLSVRGRTYAVAVPTGSFGYRIQRPTEVRAWNEYVMNADRLDANTYRLEIPADQAAAITTGVKTEESTGLFLGARAGAAIPLYVFAGNYIIGPGGSVEFGIKLTQLFSLALDVGYNFLIEPSGGNGFNTFYATANVRAAMEFGPLFYMYLQAGLYVYTPDFAFFDVGFSTGLAAGLSLSRYYSLELGVDYLVGLATDKQSMVLVPRIGFIVKF